MNLNTIDKLKRLNYNEIINISIKSIDKQYLNKTLERNSINIIIVNRNFNDRITMINLVIKIIFIKILNFHRKLVNKIIKIIDIDNKTTQVKINFQTFSFCRQSNNRCKLRSTQQTSTSLIRITRNNDNFLNLILTINKIIINKVIINFDTRKANIRVFNSRIKLTFSKI